MKKASFIYLGLLLVFLNTAQAKITPAEADQQQLDAVTVFMDVNRLTRKNLAAKKMTRIHKDFAQYGYELISVNPYIENSDLEGFFLSYRKRR